MNRKTVALLATILILSIAIVIGVSAGLNRQDQKTTQQDAPQPTKTFTAEEVASHNSKNDCWTIISGQVYDLTEYINRHPGSDEILRACGAEATTLFDARQTTDGKPVGSGAPHSQAAREQLDRLKIGTLITN